ncbi:ABC transporter permease [Oceanimonas baumannii]|uniref:ABC transporter permease n=1 Tax=Oceanimonas baumannii TaxID=129578 RepID=A0A235CMK5_9GAMM|nr:ABC transporter permease subunit [Oceanimonas baumannii]OYD25257.1 ABC transporter permease [Oceanimonas baumannii]TDW62449.1 putative spermidine/putrescine transport system permease protein [Oceanimonas baumannii]
MRATAWLYLLYLLTPIILLFIGSFGEAWTNTLFPSGFTLDWYHQVWTDSSFIRAFKTSIWVTFLTCVAGALLALPFCYAVHIKMSRRGKVASRLLIMLPIAVPELVLGFGFILVFSSDTLPWLGNSWLLVMGHIVITLPYLVYNILTDLEKSSLFRLDQVTRSLGGNALHSFFDVYLPLVSQSLLTGLITVAAISIGEFQLSNLIAGFMSRTYPVVLLQAFYGAAGFACAATVILLLLAILFALLSTSRQLLTSSSKHPEPVS